MEIGRAQDSLCQPMTLGFRVGGVSGAPSVGQLRHELTEIYLQAKAAGEVSNPREDLQRGAICGRVGICRGLEPRTPVSR